MLSDLPIELKHVESFQSMLESCDQAYNGTRPNVEPIEYETHYDPDLVSSSPYTFTLITPHTLVLTCTLVPYPNTWTLTTNFSHTLHEYTHSQPLVTLDFIRHCDKLLEKLKNVFKSKPKYK